MVEGNAVTPAGVNECDRDCDPVDGCRLRVPFGWIGRRHPTFSGVRTCRGTGLTAELLPTSITLRGANSSAQVW